MALKTIEERLRNIVMEQLGVSVEAVTASATFEGDLAADSLDVVELTMALEEEFGIEISDDEIAELQTVGKLQAYIEKRLGKVAGSGDSLGTFRGF